MERIKIRIQINKGKEGAPLSKLASINKETERFLRLLGEDTGLPVSKGEWIATNFENNSVDYDIAFLGDYETTHMQEFNKGMLFTTNYEPEQKKLNGRVRHETLRQFAKITDSLDIDEKIDFGLYETGKEKPAEWKPLTKERADRLKRALEAKVEYYGTIYGVVHALFKGTDPPYFTINDYLTQNRVKCIFDDAYYNEVLEALKTRKGIVYASGMITSERISRQIEKLIVSKIHPAPKMSEEEYEAFFGSFPDITGDLTTEEYIDILRLKDD